MVFLKKLSMVVLAILCCVGLSSCMKFTGIKPYDNERDRAFISKEMLDLGDEADTYIDLDATSAIMSTSLIPNMSHEETEKYITLTGIPESAFVRDDKRWVESIVIRIDEQLIYVYLVGGKPVSFIRIFRFGDEFVISHFKTVDEYQGKGIGGKMVAHAVTECKKRGAKKISIMTGKDNAAALHVYTKNGFVSVREFGSAGGSWKQVVLEYRGPSK